MTFYQQGLFNLDPTYLTIFIFNHLFCLLLFPFVCQLHKGLMFLEYNFCFIDLASPSTTSAYNNPY
jgi:hypothetical protein